MATCITNMTTKDFKNHKCEMCDKQVYMKKTFTWHPLAQALSGATDMTICEPCAKREHGYKNKYTWKALVKDLS